MDVKAKLTRQRIESYRVWLQSLPPARTRAVREEMEALCDMAAEAEALCEQLETLEGLMAVGDKAKIFDALGKVRIMLSRYRAPKQTLS